MKRAIAWVLVFAVGMLGGVLTTYQYYKKNPKVVLKKVVVKETMYIKQPTTLKEYKECYESKIRIQATTKDDKILITAYDDCKSADAEINLEAKKDIKEYVSVGLVGFAVGVLIVLLL